MKKLCLLILALVLISPMKAQFSNELFQATDTTICVGDSISFSALYPNMNCYTYSWDLGNGINSNSKHRFGYRFQQSGDYQMEMEMQGDSILRRIRRVTVHRIPSGWSEWPFDKLTKPDLYLIIRDSSGRGIVTTRKINLKPVSLLSST